VKKDVPGFVGNRIQHAMLREALYLIDDGICDAEAIDIAVRYGFGFRFIACGPIMQKEMSGWDTNLLVGTALYPELYKNDAPPKMLKEMVERNHLGMKTKRGMWEWTDEAIAKEKAGIERRLQAGMAILKDDK
jgi:3-hydroxybutyryl-CoA dehydrogenase